MSDTVTIEATDEQIRQVLAEADLTTLIPALAYETGDLDLLRPEFRPNPLDMSGAEHGGIPPSSHDEIRRIAFDVLTSWRDGTTAPHPVKDPDSFRAILDFMTGGLPDDDYVPLLTEELDLEGVDPRAPDWTLAELAPDRRFRMVIVGAGMSGLLAAHRAKQAGLEVTVVELADDVGGTWLKNTYPGCRVDNPNHLYSYSFAQRDDWPYYYSPQSELHAYFRRCAEDWGVLDDIRFGTEVIEARFDPGEGIWRVEVDGGAGSEILEAEAFVSAVGQLNRPHIPDIDGAADFAGPMFHSAEWDHSVDLAGKKVVIIGNGASAAQFTPHVVEAAAETTVFCRTPNWFFAVPTYHDPLPSGLIWLFEHVPSFRAFYRAWIFWRTADGMLPAFMKEPGWEGEGAIGSMNAMIRGLLEDVIKEAYGDRPDLVDRMIPDYPPAAKRIILDNGSYPAALKDERTNLVFAGVSHLVPEGVVDADGRLHEADVVIWGTGFEAEKFLVPMKVFGLDGTDLHGRWDGDARAYMGVTVPEFPNLFILYGPNTNIVVNGSTVYFAEQEVFYTMRCIETLLAGGHRWMAPTTEAHDEYNAMIDEGNQQMAWGAVHVHSWYRNAKGRIAQNWPFTVLKYWQQTREVDTDAYEFG